MTKCPQCNSYGRVHYLWCEQIKRLRAARNEPHINGPSLVWLTPEEETLLADLRRDGNDAAYAFWLGAEGQRVPA